MGLICEGGLRTGTTGRTGTKSDCEAVIGTDVGTGLGTGIGVTTGISRGTATWAGALGATGTVLYFKIEDSHILPDIALG